MANATRVQAKPSLAEFLMDQYETKKREVRLSERRYYSQNEYAANVVGILPQSFSRFINGDTVMTMDSAVILITCFKQSVLDHFEYGPDSSLSRVYAETLAMLAEDDDIARGLSALASMRPAQRKAVAAAIARAAEEGVEGTQFTLATV